jgi:hypothetical protein
MDHLKQQAYKFELFCSKLSDTINRAIKLSAADSITAKAALCFAVIKLHDQWNYRSREIVLLSCIGNCHTLTGKRLARSTILSGLCEPLAYLRENWASHTHKNMGSSWEPDWHVPSNTIRAASMLRCCNVAEIQNAFGAITIIEDVRNTRNVIVHALPKTFIKYKETQKRHYIGNKVEPIDFVLYRLEGTGPLMIDYWMDQMQQCFKAAIS